jgi:hypothetical protein
VIDWFWPQLSFKVIPAYACLFILVGILIYGLAKYGRSETYDKADLIIAWPHVFYFFAYSAALIITASTIGLTSMATGRLSIPAFLPLMMGGLLLLDMVSRTDNKPLSRLHHAAHKSTNSSDELAQEKISSLNKNWHRFVIIIFGVTMLLSLRYTLIRFSSTNRRFTIDGPDELHQFRWRDLGLWDDLSAMDDESVIWYSDHPYFVYLYTGQITREVPHTRAGLRAWLETVVPAHVQDGMTVRIIWTGEVDAYYEVDEAAFQNLLQIQPASTHDGGHVYLIAE